MPHHLTMQERDVIAKMYAQGASQSAIARAWGRSPSTISRELRRNGTAGGYGAAQAHEAAQQRHQRLVRQLPADQRHSLTIDNGSEFARCSRLKRSYNMEVYTCRPGRPQERATNENTNGLIRQFLPKGCDFRAVSHQTVQRIQRLLNDRPRARLGYRIPAEVFFGKTERLLCN
ncbi:MAG: hypothetical protein KatS3mg109_1941 [Pirellulaceae bacterium]|nr:MAG: hypothetical protein KatS3mg109_1941 [Pirellulaceae bacterium]